MHRQTHAHIHTSHANTQAGARVRPLSAPRVVRSPSVTRRPASAAGQGATAIRSSSSSIAASVRQSGGALRQLSTESPARRYVQACV